MLIMMADDDKAGNSCQRVVSVCAPKHAKAKNIYADVVSQLPRKDRGTYAGHGVPVRMSLQSHWTSGNLHWCGECVRARGFACVQKKWENRC